MLEIRSPFRLILYWKRLNGDDTVPDGLYCYPAQNKARTEKTEPCISKPAKEALPEPNCEMGVFLFSGDKCINGQ